MGDKASVESIDALKGFKVALWKFQEASNVSLADAESEIHRSLNWLENEQPTHWQMQIRKRQELVARCKEAVRMKKLFKDSSGRQQSAIDEEKALAIAVKRLEEANIKFANTKSWSRKLQREMMVYKGDVQRFATAIQSDIPVAVAHLEQLIDTLEQYTAVAPVEAVSTADAGTADAGVSMARTEPETQSPAEKKEESKAEAAPAKPASPTATDN